MKAALPHNEVERVKALQQSGLLDTPPDEDFDQLIRLASVICETPIALLTLVDQDRQWFKARIGMPASETSRDIALCAHTILEDDLLLVPDATRDARFRDNPMVTGEPLLRFYAGIPLEVEGGHRLGSLCVIDRTPRELSPAQIEALQLLAKQARKLINVRRQQHALRQVIARSSLIEHELRASQELFHAFMDNAPFMAFMKDAEGRMAYYNQQYADWFGVSREAWLGKDDAELWPPALAHDLRAKDLSVLRHWTALIVEEASERLEGEQTEWRCYKFPFRDTAGREYVAQFAVDITVDKEAERQIRIYQGALEDANVQLLELAVTDGLTGLRNRRSFDESLTHEFSISTRYANPLSLLLIDIDNFKNLNDTHGHGEGDRVLQGVAKAISKSFRSSDIVARYGGEEFAIILPNTTKQSAAETAERLRQTIADLRIGRHEITISIGLSTLDISGWSQAEFVRRADSALYRAKREGKNQVCYS